ncbi:hypothetical protein [Sphingopyxis sp. PET50]|uniref:hypothetical protein n=1 Tax=Sphingopyxis sp. PET50 TaxID=2976533 RepID=UPI0021AEB730|nr:hypothetical protein [Sphingopyxis sp. PET50]
MLQSAEWNLKEKDNKSGVFITKLPGYENKILAIPVDGKEIGFNVILLDSKNPNTVKYMSRYNFKIPQKYRADSVKMSEKYPEVHKFVESH